MGTNEENEAMSLDNGIVPALRPGKGPSRDWLIGAKYRSNQPIPT